jgi:aromatic-L-amino-acid decarboxylase
MDMMPLLSTLEVLEKSSRTLEMSPQQVEECVEQLGKLTLEFLSNATTAPAFTERLSVSEANALDLGKTDTPADILKAFYDQILSSGINSSSGKFMGYIPGGGLLSAAFADFLAAMTNRFVGLYQPSPGATQIENDVVAWLVEKFEMPTGSWGTLTSGGSAATLIALTAARSQLARSDWMRAKIYVTSQTHMAAARALNIIGFDKSNIHEISTDSQLRMSIEHLEKAIISDRAAGFVPWLVCSTAGSTNTGAVDDLEKLSNLCKQPQNNLWLHIDAAYGGFFYLCNEKKTILKGISTADSLVLDPHKGMFMPYGCGAVLVKDAKILKKAFSAEADYLADDSSDIHTSPADYSFELTRHFRAPRIWISLKMFGVEPFKDALSEKLLLANYLHDELQNISELDVPWKPQLSIVAFRIKGDDSENSTKELLAFLVSRGNAHVSSTLIFGKIYLRACILSFRTHLEEVKILVEEIKAYFGSK